MADLRRPVPSRALTVRTTIAAAAGLASSMVPVFLFAALSGQIGAELAFGPQAVGVAVTVFFVAAGLAAVPGGRLTERIGPRRALGLGALVSGLASVGIGAGARTWWHAAALLAVAGTALGLTDTGAARALADRVRSARQGLAFGVKEASVPGASLLAGVAVPALGLTIGWRPTFMAGFVLVPVVWALLPRRLASPAPAPSIAPSSVTDAGRRPALLLLAVGSALGAGAATATAAFLVPAAVAGGISPGPAGLLLAAGSAAGIGTRLVVGWGADRGGGAPVALVALLMAGGALGLAALAAAPEGPAVVAGALVALGAGWGWTGLVFLAAVRADPRAPAAAAGIVLAGLSVGGATGPLAFGALVGVTSYPAVWGAAAVTMGLGAAATAVAHLRATR